MTYRLLPLAFLLLLGQVHAAPLYTNDTSILQKRHEEATQIRRAYLSQILGPRAPSSGSGDANLLEDLSSHAISRLVGRSWGSSNAAKVLIERSISDRESSSAAQPLKEKRQFVLRPQADDGVVQQLRFHQAYAAAAYCLFGLETWTCRERCTATPGTVMVRRFNTLVTDTVGFVAFNPQIRAVIVSFRGTLSPQNLAVDFSILPLDLNYPEAPGALVHSGFYTAYMSVADDVRSAVASVLAQFPDFEVHAVGHSMGGALASIAVPDLMKSFPSQSFKLFTYGMPRVGNRAFANFVSNKLGEGRIFRTVHGTDMIPTVPPLTIGFQHHRQEFFLNPLLRTVQTCQDQDGEDLLCSNGIIPVPDIASHIIGYFDITFGPFC
ncbi:hypothetical protein HK102_002157 [Quaeritorhiza haematococci]|nr:hypothetical protein HK102_002157 [Quaeritorhiza haematococci]